MGALTLSRTHVLRKLCEAKLCCENRHISGMAFNHIQCGASYLLVQLQGNAQLPAVLNRCIKNQKILPLHRQHHCVYRKSYVPTINARRQHQVQGCAGQTCCLSKTCFNPVSSNGRLQNITGFLSPATIRSQSVRGLLTSAVAQSPHTLGVSSAGPLSQGHMDVAEVVTATELGLGASTESVSHLVTVTQEGSAAVSPVVVTNGLDATEVASGPVLLFPDFPTIHGAETAILKLHELTGLPWWCTVMVTALALRSILITPLSVFALHNAERLNSLQPKVAEVAKRLKVEVSMAMHQFKWDEKRAKDEYIKNIKRLVKEMYISNNCHPMKSTASFWLQFPLWISVSYSLRNMSCRAVNPELDGHTACQGLTQEGILWFPDLTMVDSTWVLPLLMGCVTLFNIEMTQLNVGEVTKYRKRLTYFLRFVALMFVPICSTMPSIMVLYWVSSGTLAAFQNILQDFSPFRRLVRLPHSPVESSNPVRALVGRAKLKYFGP